MSWKFVSYVVIAYDKVESCLASFQLCHLVFATSKLSFYCIHRMTCDNTPTKDF